MTDATSSPNEVSTVTLNALLIELIPLAFLETVAPGNDFVPMNNQAAAFAFSAQSSRDTIIHL
jgi:hypothetical protein